MNHEYKWLSWAIALIMVIITGVVSVTYGHSEGEKHALERLCNKTHGRYDFCQTTVTTTYKVVIPDPCLDGIKNGTLDDNEWAECFGNPIFELNEKELQ